MIEYIVGINCDRIVINGKRYIFGMNCSYLKRFARYAQKDHDDAIKYGWKTPYNLKPFIGDILDAECPDWRTAPWKGFSVFAGRDLTPEEIEKVKREIERECESDD